MVLLLVWVAVLLLSIFGIVIAVKDQAVKLGLICSVVMIFTLSMTHFMSFHTPMSGEKVGIFTKINSQGLIYKTYEAEIIRGGMNGGTGNLGQAFQFTVPSSLYKDAHDALEAQAEVKIRYHQPFVCLTFTSENACVFLDSVEKK
jgi:hypothetical protein